MSKLIVACVALSAAVIGGAAGWAAWTSDGASCPLGGSSCCVDGDTEPCGRGVPMPCDGDGPSPSCCAEAGTPVAAVSAANTVIAIEDLDCPSCAKKVITKVKEVAGVDKAEADTKASKLTVTPKDKAKLSAKALWEAVEKAGFKPTKLEGPGGVVFTSAPKE